MKLPTFAGTAIQEYITSANGKLVTLATIYREHCDEEYNVCAEEMKRHSLEAGWKFFNVKKGGVSDPEEGRRQLLQTEFCGDYLLFIDSDQIFPEDTLVRLASHNVPICGTLVVGKSPPHYPVTAYGNPTDGFQPILNWPKDALIEADVTGFGCILIKREVFEAFPEGNPFRKVFSEKLDKNLGEDWSFCIRARELGFKIHVDTSLPIGHKGSYFYTVEDYIQNYQRDIIQQSMSNRFSKQATQPRVVRKLSAHPAMERVRWSPDRAERKTGGLALMGENGK